VYLRARYYDSTIGRFINEDPALDGLNWYIYCGNNPIMFIDPSGLWGKDVHYGFSATYYTPYNASYGTLFWALTSGLSQFHAEIVAEANNNVDKSNPAGHPWNRHMHFRVSGSSAGGAWGYFTERYNDAVKRWKNIFNSPFIGHAPAQIAAGKRAALTELGKGLHALQDYHAHMDWNSTHLIFGAAHKSWSGSPGNKGTSATTFFDDVDYNIKKGSDGDYYHSFVGRNSNPRFINTKDDTIKYIKQFIKDVDY
jgi:uncharacterized protein RhaS with RHS repeats